MSTKTDPPDHLLSVVSGPEGNVVHIHADRGGLEHLRKAIDRLLKRLDEGETDHEHLHSPDWGGWDLTTSMVSSEKDDGYKTVHHIKVYGWDAEWKQKHRL